jgi:hypothetical protein
MVPPAESQTFMTWRAGGGRGRGGGGGSEEVRKASCQFGSRFCCQ